MGKKFPMSFIKKSLFIFLSLSLEASAVQWHPNQTSLKDWVPVIQEDFAMTVLSKDKKYKNYVKNFKEMLKEKKVRKTEKSLNKKVNSQTLHLKIASIIRKDKLFHSSGLGGKTFSKMFRIYQDLKQKSLRIYREILEQHLKAPIKNNVLKTEDESIKSYFNFVFKAERKTESAIRGKKIFVKTLIKEKLASIRGTAHSWRQFLSTVPKLRSKEHAIFLKKKREILQKQNPKIHFSKKFRRKMGKLARHIYKEERLKLENDPQRYSEILNTLEKVLEGNTPFYFNCVSKN